MFKEENGIIVVNKPAGLSSAGVVSWVKRLTGARKVGHAGTLDPFATGILICCINRATRLSRFFLESQKTYEAVLRLGIETDTQDATGSVVRRGKVNDFSADHIETIFKRFIGPMEQKPPVYSALKHQGVSLYKLARRGQPVQKPARPVNIFHLTVGNICLPDIRFVVTCSSGTYIRTLCADIGTAMGCGGHLYQLRRLACCGFHIDDAVDLEGLENARNQGTMRHYLIDMADALKHLPKRMVDRQIKDKIRHGIGLTEKDISPEAGNRSEGYIKIIDDDQKLVAVIRQHSVGKPYTYCCVFT